MLNFTARSYRTFVEIILWINLISCPIIGGIVTNEFRITPILGIFLGLVVGFLTNILCGGFIAIILKIDENLEIIKNNSFRTETSETKVSKTKVSLSDPLNLL